MFSYVKLTQNVLLNLTVVGDVQYEQDWAQHRALGNCTEHDSWRP